MWQRTLAILKPDVMHRGNDTVNSIFRSINERGLKIAETKWVELSVPRAEEFYKEHKGKFYYERLVNYISSGPITVAILEGQDAIAEWRRIMGPTHPWRARSNPATANTVRAQYGESDTRNSVHGSDSVESAEKEIKFFLQYMTVGGKDI